MITDDDVMQLFERADPARVPAELPRLDAIGYLDALRLRSADIALTDISSPPAPPRDRHRLITLAAVILLGVLVAGGGIALFVRSTTRDAVTNPPVRPPAVQVATNFLAAYTAYDADRVASLLSADADVSALWNGPDWRLGLRYMKATGLSFIVKSCDEVASSPSLTLVRCPFAYNALRSDQMGLGPYDANGFVLTIRDGKIVRALMNFPLTLGTGFREQVWEPFASWVATNFPDDAAVMYSDRSHISASITEESIPLWEEHTTGYVDDVNQTLAAYIVQAKDICSAATAAFTANEQAAATLTATLSSVAAVDAAIAPAEKALDELHALPTPGGRLVEFYALSDQLIVVLHEIRDAISAGDTARAQELIQQHVDLTRQLDAAVPGLQGCPIAL